HVIGTLKETVVGNVSTHDGIAWNVTETLLLLVEHRSSVLGPEPGMASQDGPSANVSGFVWYRQADLAPLYARKSVHMVRTWNVSSPEDMSTFDHMWLNGTYTLTYDAGTEVWFHPGLTVLRFPLAENVTYNVTSNATIHTWSSFKVNGPNVTWGTDHFATFTVPIGLTLRTGQFENVTTPAGTFRALPVSAYRRPFVPPTEDRDANVVTNLTLETDCETPHAFATAWFSAQAGNVVRADLGLGGFEGPRIVLTLVAYSSG
ncbi:MAG TPA: hypothetical protein VEY12_11665, partial [Thermoplasmata archaeon]|nr:hypothetical protein [Thermoplasmata archaeon]